jgi:hypothetical protein
MPSEVDEMEAKNWVRGLLNEREDPERRIWQPRGSRWATYRVAFDGQWQESFGTFFEADSWALEVAATGRTVWVTERRLLTELLVAVHPESKRIAAARQWQAGQVSGTGGGGGAY